MTLLPHDIKKLVGPAQQPTDKMTHGAHTDISFLFFH